MKLYSTLNKLFSYCLVVFIYLFIFLFSSCNTIKQQDINNSTESAVQSEIPQSKEDKFLIDEDKMMATIKTLCTKSRKIGSKEEREACLFLKNELESHGYKTYMQNFSYRIEKGGLKRETFFNVNVTESEKDGESQNLIAIKKPVKTTTDDIIIISAHYDSVKNSPGANDNGSGVAVLLEVARQLANHPVNTELRFILFGGEENILYGSRYYLSQLSKGELSRIKADINLDTIAQKGNSDIIFYIPDGIGDKDNAASLMLKDVDEGKNVVTKSGPLSDYFTFSQFGIPSVNIGQELLNLNCNTPDDVIGSIDTKKLTKAANILLKAMIKFTEVTGT